MPKQRFGLGRGLDALIPGGPSGATTIPDDVPMDTSLSNSALFEVPVADIMPNPSQPRTPAGDDQQMLELATSIQEHGLLQPLLLTVAEGGDDPRYYIIAGERRWRAAQIAGLEAVPAVIREATPQMMLELALVENLQRTDLNPLEEARGFQMLIEEYGLTQEQVAERVGRDRATIANTIRLLQLPQEVRDALITMPKAFTEGHARAVLQINGEAERILATKQIISQMMTVRQAEELARRYNEMALGLTPERRGARIRQQTYETRALEEAFTRAVEMKARLHRSTKGKGYLTLYFSSDEQLQSLYGRIIGGSMPSQEHDTGLNLGALGYGFADADDLLDEDMLDYDNSNGSNGSNGRH